MNIIKTYFYPILVTISLLFVGYSCYWAYNQGKEYIRRLNNDALQKAIAEKTRIEKEQNIRYEQAQTGYAYALSVLNDRLRNTPTVSRGGCVPVAGSSSTGQTMPSTSTDTGELYIDLETVNK